MKPTEFLLLRSDRVEECYRTTRENLWSIWFPITLGTLFYIVFIVRTAFVVNDQIYFSLFDDAMISMRYARNLAEGYGLVWNPGQPPVEGYTNLLWTLWMAVLHLWLVSESKISLLVMLSGGLILIVNALVVGRIMARLAPRASFLVSLAVWFTVLYYPLVYWTLRGMEVGLITLLISTAVLLSLRLRDSFNYGSLIALAIIMVSGLLTRTDVIIPWVSVLGFVLITAQPGQRRLIVLVLGGTLIGTLVLHTIFRLHYYGYPFPNTYYLKIHGSSLSTRLFWGLIQFGRTVLVHLLAPITIAAGYFVSQRRKIHPAAYLLVALFLGQCAYSIYVGGDAWEWMRYTNRYITVAVPALLILSALGIDVLLHAEADQLRSIVRLLACLLAPAVLLGILDWIWIAAVEPGASRQVVLQELAQRALPGKITTGGLVFLCLTLLLLSQLRTLKWRSTGNQLLPAVRLWSSVTFLLPALLMIVINGEAFALSSIYNPCHVDEDAEMTRYGLALREVTAEQASIAVAWAGAIPYFSHRPSVDLLGKSDYVVAISSPESGRFVPGHNKRNITYSIGTLKPDVVAQLEGDPLTIEAYGYEPVADGVFIRSDSKLVDRVALAEAVRQRRIPRTPRRVPLCRGEGRQ